MAQNLSHDPAAVFFEEGLIRQASTGTPPTSAIQQSVDGANQAGKKAESAYKDVVSHIAVLEALRQAEPVRTSRARFHARLKGMGLKMSYAEYNKIATSIVKLVVDYPKFFVEVDQFDAPQFRGALDAFGNELKLDFGNTNALFTVSMQKVSVRFFFCDLNDVFSHSRIYRLSYRLPMQQRRLPTQCALKPKSNTKRLQTRRVVNELRSLRSVVFLLYFYCCCLTAHTCRR
jgi:hypothetical protein